MPRKGQTLTPEQRQKVSEAAKKRWESEDERIAQSKRKKIEWSDPSSVYRQMRAKQTQSNAPGWKGGEIIRRGYVYIYSPEHPRGQRHKDHYVKRSHLVMEKIIGRFLNKGEVVHHCNGDRADDRPENLVLTTRSAHTTDHWTERKANGWAGWS